MSDDLDTLSDQELNERFAVEVSGWKHRTATKDRPIDKGGMRLPNHFSASPIEAWWNDSDNNHTGVYCMPPRFATDANAVLPWLEKQNEYQANRIYDLTPFTTVSVWPFVKRNGVSQGFSASAPTFARAACIALIRAKLATK